MTRELERRDYLTVLALLGISCMVVLVLPPILDYILQEIYAPAASARGPGHFGSHGINKHYRLARGR